MLAQALRNLVHDARNSTALEIGPGTAPLIPQLPFKHMTFVEQSTALAKGLPYTAIAAPEFGTTSWLKSHIFTGMPERKNVRIVAADLRRLPFNENAHFDVGVMNEVLTHIPPSERLNALKKMAELSDHLLIIDRERVPFQQLKDKRETYLGKLLEEQENLRKEVHGVRGRQTQGYSQRLHEINEALERYRSFTPAELRSMHGTLVDFSQLITYLQRLGMQVHIERKTSDSVLGIEYVILTAKKAK